MSLERTDVESPRLPSLDAGVTLFEPRDGVGPTPLYSLVLDHLVTADGTAPALWVDTGRTARASDLARLAPSPRLLDRIQVARGFTPHQHLALVRAATRGTTAATPLLVVPRVDRRYRTDDCPRGVAETALSTVARRLDRVATRRDCPVVVTRDGDDALTAPIEDIATESIRVEDTQFGPQFRGEDFETTVYPVDGSAGIVQTTLAFWARVLEHQARASTGAEPRDGVTGVVASGTQ